ncbi:MAG: glycoside hydrolase family 99-like domain-containing protein, partial [Deltaproteobacteria bacterium]|nr:glycoside hydrolase family 99-like domain-containing protein [Deltaproteobacteria bacterium]
PPGQYDLRLEEARIAQAELAREYGIYGFCYYHYWFNGKRLLERPFNEVLASGRPDFPFCLCWANEEWTRAWDGRTSETLIGQSYDSQDDVNHIRWLINAFRDERYIRIEGKPLFFVYRASKLPDSLNTTNIWREEAAKAGIGDIFLARVESMMGEYSVDPVKTGFDAAVEFQPRWRDLGKPFDRGFMSRVLARVGFEQPYMAHRFYDYGSVVERMINEAKPDYKRFSCVCPQWDNSPRRKADAVILHNSTPELYGRWLETSVKRSIESGNEFIIINAWNEWAEGNHLEPCLKWGRAYLEATRNTLQKFV